MGVIPGLKCSRSCIFFTAFFFFQSIRPRNHFKNTRLLLFLFFCSFSLDTLNMKYSLFLVAAPAAVYGLGGINLPIPQACEPPSEIIARTNGAVTYPGNVVSSNRIHPPSGTAPRLIHPDRNHRSCRPQMRRPQDAAHGDVPGSTHHQQWPEHQLHHGCMLPKGPCRRLCNQFLGLGGDE